MHSSCHGVACTWRSQVPHIQSPSTYHHAWVGRAVCSSILILHEIEWKLSQKKINTVNCTLSRQKKLHLTWKQRWIKYKGKMLDCCTFCWYDWVWFAWHSYPGNLGSIYSPFGFGVQCSTACGQWKIHVLDKTLWRNAPLFRLSAIGDIIYFHCFLQKNLFSKIDMSGGSRVSHMEQAIMLWN